MSEFESHGFAKMEQHMGTDAYQAEVRRITAIAELIEMQTKMRSAAAGIIALCGVFAIVVMMPVVVWLWKWAL